MLSVAQCYAQLFVLLNSIVINNKNKTMAKLDSKHCYIYIARLKDAPQVRITSRVEPFISLNSCIEWCNKYTFSWVIREWTKDSPSLSDKVLAKE